MENQERKVYLTSNVYITNEESVIIDYLVDRGEMPGNFSENHVISFYVNEDFHLVLFFSLEGDQGFQMYVVEDFSVHPDDLLFLRALFAQLVAEGHNTALFKKAHYRIDTVLRMSRTLRAVIHTEGPDLDEED